MWGWLAKIALPIFIEKIMTAIKEYIDKIYVDREAKRKIKEKIDDILKDPDPVSRAKRMADFLNA